MAIRATWLRYGCFGCLGLTMSVMVLVLVVAATAYFTSRPERVEERVLTPELPAEMAEGRATGGEVVVVVQEAELHVVPVEAGEPLRVTGRYDVNAFALEGQLEPAVDGERAWVYRASFGRAEDAGAFSGLVSVARGSTARIDVFLPVDLHLDLVLRMRGGGAVVRLGGLWLGSADLDVDSGAIDLNITEPLREPMENLTIRTSRGGALLNRLGNGSPRRLDVSYRTGHIDMDLGGDWRADAQITIKGRTGGGVVHLPGEVILEGLRRHGVERAGAPEANLPTLTFSVSTGMGWLEFSDMVNRGRVPEPTLEEVPSGLP